MSKTLDYIEKLKSGSAKTEGGAVIDIEATALTTVYILADWTADFRRYLSREEFVAMPGGGIVSIPTTGKDPFYSNVL